MFFTNDEMNDLRNSLETQSGLTAELHERCGPLMHMGKYTEAVRTACVLLEEELRNKMNSEQYGIRLVDGAFDPGKGPLALHIGNSKQERLGLHDIYRGAFRLFRNPVAHGAVQYDATEAKSVLGFINLLLLILERAEELPPPGTFLENWEAALAGATQILGPNATSQLRVFLGKCEKLGLIAGHAHRDIPYKYRAVVRDSADSDPYTRVVRLFFVTITDRKAQFRFPLAQYYSGIIGFDLEWYRNELTKIGASGNSRNLYINLLEQHEPEMFDGLVVLLEQVCAHFDANRKMNL